MPADKPIVLAPAVEARIKAALAVPATYRDRDGRVVPRVRVVIGGRESPTNAVAAAEEEGRDTPFDTQVSECLDRIEREEGWRLVAPPFLTVVSRSELWDRADLNPARAMVREGKADVILYHATERLTVGDKLAYVMVEVERYGGRLEFVVDPIDPTTVNGQVVLMAKSVAGLIEQQRTRERTLRGRQTRLDAGRALPGPRARYGYQWVMREVGAGAKARLIKDRREAHPDHAPVVERLFVAAAGGTPTHQQVEDLFKDNIPSPTGNPRWTKSSIRFILRDPIYKGEPRALRWKMETRRRLGRDGRPTGETYRTMRERPLAEQRRLEGDAPALVKPATWELAQLRLDQNEANASRNNKYPDATPLRGYAFCAACGARLHVEITRTRAKVPAADRPAVWFRLYCPRRKSEGVRRLVTPEGVEVACTPSLDAGRLLDEVWNGLRHRLAQPDIRRATLKGARNDDAARADVDACALRLAQLKRDIDRHQRQLLNIDPDEKPDVFVLVRDKLQELKSHLPGVEAQQQERQAAQAAAEGRGVAWELARAHWGPLLEEAPPAARAEMFFMLGLRLEVWHQDAALRPLGVPWWEARGRLPIPGEPVVQVAGGAGAIGTNTRRSSVPNTGASRHPAVLPPLLPADVPLVWAASAPTLPAPLG